MNQNLKLFLYDVTFAGKRMKVAIKRLQYWSTVVAASCCFAPKGTAAPQIGRIVGKEGDVNMLRVHLKTRVRNFKGHLQIIFTPSCSKKMCWRTLAVGVVLHVQTCSTAFRSRDRWKLDKIQLVVRTLLSATLNTWPKSNHLKPMQPNPQKVHVSPLTQGIRGGIISDVSHSWNEALFLIDLRQEMFTRIKCQSGNALCGLINISGLLCFFPQEGALLLLYPTVSTIKFHHEILILLSSFFLCLQYERHKNKQHTRNFAKSVVNLVDGVSKLLKYPLTHVLLSF